MLASLGLHACDTIYKGDQLSSAELAHIRALGLLDSDEKIYQFYSNFKGVKGAGNFYTTKRIAHYWRYHETQQTDFAYYRDIAAINLTPHPAGDFTIPFLTIVKKDKTQFRVYVDGRATEVTAFFASCRTHWLAGR
ncbi:MAG: hypothetical protein EOO57_16920 [Hymenobacter sp.]|nr:MAG: hypothetical protein EOO57_16920 [Hymenobacter sp.]